MEKQIISLCVFLSACLGGGVPGGEMKEAAGGEHPLKIPNVLIWPNPNLFCVSLNLLKWSQLYCSAIPMKFAFISAYASLSFFVFDTSLCPAANTLKLCSSFSSHSSWKHEHNVKCNLWDPNTYVLNLFFKTVVFVAGPNNGNLSMCCLFRECLTWGNSFNMVLI